MKDTSGGTGSGYHREEAWLEITIMLVVVEVLVWCIVKAIKAIRARKQ